MSRLGRLEGVVVYISWGFLFEKNDPKIYVFNTVYFTGHNVQYNEQHCIPPLTEQYRVYLGRALLSHRVLYRIHLATTGLLFIITGSWVSIRKENN